MSIKKVSSFINGLAGKSNPLVGAALQVGGMLKNKVVDHLAKNKASKIGGEGKRDYSELAGIALFTVISVIGLALIASGKITFQQLMQLLDLL